MVKATEVVKDLGAKFNQHLQMDADVAYVCQTAYNQICNISKNVLTQISAETLIALVLSELDIGNALLPNISKELLIQLQRVQNAAARRIMGLQKHDPISKALASLHWLQDHQFQKTLSHL
jgi:hypothetical protein